MDTLLRRRIMMATGGEPPTPVPPYRPVEYLENPSNARIDTGIVGNGTWEFSAVINATPGTTAIVLGRKSSGSGWIGHTVCNTCRGTGHVDKTSSIDAT